MLVPYPVILCLYVVVIAALAMVNYVERHEFNVWLENERETWRKVAKAAEFKTGMGMYSVATRLAGQTKMQST